jgi:hypothetical protein
MAKFKDSRFAKIAWDIGGLILYVILFIPIMIAIKLFDLTEFMIRRRNREFYHELYSKEDIKKWVDEQVRNKQNE